MKQALVAALSLGLALCASSASAGGIVDTILKSTVNGSTNPTPCAVADNQGNLLCPDDLTHTFTVNGSGQPLTDTATDGTHTWVQSYTYSGGFLATTSNWVRTQ